MPVPAALMASLAPLEPALGQGQPDLPLARRTLAVGLAPGDVAPVQVGARHVGVVDLTQHSVRKVPRTSISLRYSSVATMTAVGVLIRGHLATGRAPSGVPRGGRCGHEVGLPSRPLRPPLLLPPLAAGEGPVQECRTARPSACRKGRGPGHDSLVRVPPAIVGVAVEEDKVERSQGGQQALPHGGHSGPWGWRHGNSSHEHFQREPSHSGSKNEGDRPSHGPTER
jgi:hypothetical protein